MTVEELEQLVHDAAKQLRCLVVVKVGATGWHAIKHGQREQGIESVTCDQLVSKLKEWARPPKPDTVPLHVPYEEAVDYARRGMNPQFRELCRQAIAPYEGESNESPKR